ncbi:hypothetical protein [Halorhodospira halochloris]|uniref:hypothetical protein n=1 Tax=Halorhodospira halochloris TaxID=1052 RepID=UPI001EE82C2C|nr:hypothetical protein [Halorhodospira halochloris]MCG5548922.1 hypothetical protein [Halorhodospira halochloris]
MHNILHSPGRVLFVDGERIFASKANKLLETSDSGQTWNEYAILPFKFSYKIAVRSNYATRLLRLGVHHLNFFDEGGVAIANRDTFLIKDGTVSSLGSLHGKRPLTLCSSGDTVHYGEYRSNPERSPVSIYSLDTESYRWVRKASLDCVRHIHGVFYDRFTSSLWVTTGDTDQESAIWRGDTGLENLVRVVGGSQQLRAVQLLFTENYVYFGSDTPNEVNHIYRINRSDYRIECLARVNGSVFFGTKAGDSLFFSTAVEPSTENKHPYAEVWQSDNGYDWKIVLRFKKDMLPMKYFQYGQVRFPVHTEHSERCYCTPFATRHHGKTFALDL